MTEPPSIFREEALRNRGAPTGPGDVLRISSPWTTRAYWLLVALVAAGLVWSSVARITQTASGPAVVRGSQVLTVVPGAFASQLRAGMTMDMTRPGQPAITVTIRSVGPEVADAHAAAQRLGISASRIGLTGGPFLLVRADAPAGLADGSTGRAAIAVRSERLIVTLARALTGGGDA